MRSAWLGRSSVFAASLLLSAACHDSTTALKNGGSPSGGGNASGNPDTMYATAVVDHISGVDVTGTWGGLVLLVSSDQSLRIFSADTWSNRLRYASCDTACDQAASWASVTVDSASNSYTPSLGAVSTTSGITVVGATRPGGLRITTCATDCASAANWQAGSIFSNGVITNNGLGRSTPLAADASGGLHLILGDFFTTDLTYGECSSGCLTEGNWQTIVIDSGANTWFAKTIAVDANGHVHLVYQRTDSLLTYATCASACTTASNWHFATIDPTTYLSGYAGGFNGVSLAFGAGNAVDLAYVVKDSVKYAHCDSSCAGGGAWTVAPLGRATYDAALQADASGSLHLATNYGSVAVATCASSCGTPASWVTTRADSVPGGYYVALSLDAAGHERIASSSAFLQYTRIK
ncbi:MAG TPA: hypothetical protein VMD08_14240 [Candidatus Baltobacteraceae bacterium]|nr:hypothetical protein [Candidatus Baltobacteraceae bacterium]